MQRSRPTCLATGDVPTARSHVPGAYKTLQSIAHRNKRNNINMVSRLGTVPLNEGYQSYPMEDLNNRLQPSVDMDNCCKQCRFGKIKRCCEKNLRDSQRTVSSEAGSYSVCCGQCDNAPFSWLGTVKACTSMKSCFLRHAMNPSGLYTTRGASLRTLSPAGVLPSVWTSLAIVMLLASCVSSAAQDLRCFNVAGGPVENFFVKESLPIGSVIGTLTLEGDPSSDGDIFLKLESLDSPVQITPGSKNLTLTKPLDKEGKDGTAHVVVNIGCKKRGTKDPSINIPVNIRVTDVNDNAPVFINNPYYVNISEVTVVGTVINADILAVDQDQAGPFSTVQYSILPGPNSDLFAFQSPLRGELLLKRPLDYETDNLFNITIMAQDQGSSSRNSTTILTVQIQDADDQNPMFLNDRYMAVLSENPTKGTVVDIQPEPLMAEDKDLGIRSPIVYSFAGTEEESRWFSIDPYDGKVTLSKDLPDQVITQPTTLLIKAIQQDNPDRQGVTTLTISRRGYYSTQLQFIQREYVATVLESLPRDSLISPTTINKNIDENISFGLERDGDGVFHISPTGQVLLDFDLDFEDTQEYSLNVFVTDGIFNDTALLKVKVLNVNDWDPRFQFERYEFFVESAMLRPGDVVGKLVVADGDSGDQLSISVMGQDAKMFAISDDGELRIRDLSDLNSTEAHIVITARDSMTPPRTASVPVMIKFPDDVVKSLPLGLSNSWMLMVIFGALLAVFILVIVCLAIYIHKNKKLSDDPHATASNVYNVQANHLKKLRDDGSAATPTKITSHNGNHIQNPIPQLNLSTKDISNGLSKSRPPLRVGSPVPPDLESNNNSITAPSNNTVHTTRHPESPDGSSGEDYRPGSRGGLYVRNPTASVVPNNHRLAQHGSNGSLSGTLRSLATAVSVDSLRATHQGRPNRNPLPFAYVNADEEMPSTGSSSMASSSSSSPQSYRESDLGGARAMGGGGMPFNRVSPAPTPPGPPAPPPTTPAPPHMLTPYHEPANTGGPITNGVAWPKGSVPRRVKKLSWEDELSGHVELDPEVSVEPISGNSDGNELTVYF